MPPVHGFMAMPEAVRTWSRLSSPPWLSRRLRTSQPTRTRLVLVRAGRYNENRLNTMRFPLVVAGLWLSLIALNLAQGSIEVTAAARAQAPGELVVLTIRPSIQADHVTLRAFNREITAARIDDRQWRALVGIDLDVKPGSHKVAITARGPAGEAAGTYVLAVKSKSFPTRRLKVAPVYVEPPPDELARIREEAALQERLWNNPTPTMLWSGAFVAPVPQPANSAFGSRSIFNGVPRSPHSGADFASPAGTPIKAPNSGKVVLVRDLYFSGNSVVIDHGLGLLSVFAHLSAFEVTEGESVTTGQVIGRVGATGRVTGPHLHWTVRANTARVDPLSLLEVLGR